MAAIGSLAVGINERTIFKVHPFGVEHSCIYFCFTCIAAYVISAAAVAEKLKKGGIHCGHATHTCLYGKVCERMLPSLMQARRNITNAWAL